jgi:hypothetical protein
MMALGHAIKIEDVKNGTEEDEEASGDEEEQNVKNFAFKYLYNKAIKQSKNELVIRIDQMKSERQKNHM